MESSSGSDLSAGCSSPPLSSPMSSSEGSFKKGTWTPAEDAMLLSFVEKYGEGNWNTAHVLYPELRRGGKSCRMRFMNQLRQGLRKGPFSPAEELIIARGVALYGNQWSKISEMLPGRTDNGVKNYWNVRMKRLKRKQAVANKFNSPAIKLTVSVHDGDASPWLSNMQTLPNYSSHGIPVQWPSGCVDSNFVMNNTQMMNNSCNIYQDMVTVPALHQQHLHQFHSSERPSSSVLSPVQTNASNSSSMVLPNSVQTTPNTIPTMVLPSAQTTTSRSSTLVLPSVQATVSSSLPQVLPSVQVGTSSNQGGLIRPINSSSASGLPSVQVTTSNHDMTHQLNPSASYTLPSVQTNTNSIVNHHDDMMSWNMSEMASSSPYDNGSFMLPDQSHGISISDFPSSVVMPSPNSKYLVNSSGKSSDFILLNGHEMDLMEAFAPVSDIPEPYFLMENCLEDLLDEPSDDKDSVRLLAHPSAAIVSSNNKNNIEEDRDLLQVSDAINNNDLGPYSNSTTLDSMMNSIWNCVSHANFAADSPNSVLVAGHYN